MTTITRLNIKARGWLGWKLYDAGVRTLGHRISPDEVPEPSDKADALNACLAALVSEHMNAQGLTVAEMSRRTGIPRRELRRHLSRRGRRGAWFVNEVCAVSEALGVGVVDFFRELERDLDEVSAQ